MSECLRTRFTRTAESVRSFLGGVFPFLSAIGTARPAPNSVGMPDCPSIDSEQAATLEEAREGATRAPSRDEDQYCIERVTSLEDFRKLKEEWNGLLRPDTRHKPYLEHEWFELFLEHHGAGGQLSILLVKREQRIEAIFPFVLKRERHPGSSVRKLEFLGKLGYAMRTPIFRSQDAPKREVILRSLFRYLVESVKWDVLRLNFVPEEDFSIETLERVLSTDGLTYREHACFGGWYLDGIDSTSEEYMASRSRHIRRNIKQFTRQSVDGGDMRLEIITGGDDEVIDRWMDHFHAVYQRSWKSWEAHPTFDRALAKMARDKGYFRLGLIFVHDIPVATLLWLVCNGTAYGEKMAYDQHFRKPGPGVTLMGAMIAYLIDRDKVKGLDFLFGDDAYKKHWMSQRRERKNFFIFNNRTLRGQVLSLWSLKLQPIIRRNRLLGYFRRSVKGLSGSG